VFAWGLKSAPTVLSIHPWAYIRSMVEPMVALGIALQILWLLSRMALLSRADLSFVLPATASGYAISAFLGNFFLSERITPSHWVGIVLICLGSGFVGFTGQNRTAKTALVVNLETKEIESYENLRTGR
jgi:drug/metabolite transporter (DMT)-like permease